MKTKLLLATALAFPAALALAAPAQAQVAGIATANQMRAVISSKAFTAANQQINTTFKSAMDQVAARRTAEQNEIKPLATQIDTNKDNQLSEAEIQAAQAAKNPALDRILTAQQNADRDVARLQQPMVLAQAYAAELILAQYEGAQNRVVQAKKINMILSPDAFLYAPNGVDVTSDITAELDKAIPTAPITPPANWQPQGTTLQFLQTFNQIVAEQVQRQRIAQARQGGAQPAATTPRPAATTTPQQQQPSR